MTWDRHIVSQYTGLNFFEIGKLNIYDYLLCRRDAIITRWSQTEAGQEYLKNAWIFEQTEPDRKALRRRLRRGKDDG